MHKCHEPSAACRARLHVRRFRDWGYAAAIIQFVGATLFSISTIISVPHVLPAEASTNYWTWDATFWTLQVCSTDENVMLQQSADCHHYFCGKPGVYGNGLRPQNSLRCRCCHPRQLDSVQSLTSVAHVKLSD